MESEKNSEEYDVSVQSEADSKEYQYQEGSSGQVNDDEDIDDLFGRQDDKQSNSEGYQDDEVSFDDLFGTQSISEEYDDKEDIDDFFGGQDGKQTKSDESNDKEGSTKDNEDENFDDFFGGQDDRQASSLELDFGSGDGKSQELGGSGGFDVGSGNIEGSKEEEQIKHKQNKESQEEAVGGGITIISRPIDSLGSADDNIVNVESCQGAKRQDPCTKHDKLIRTINGECNNLHRRYI